MTAQSNGGSGHSGERSSDIHFGFGKIGMEQMVGVEVKWRDVARVHANRHSFKPGWHTVTLEDVQFRRPVPLEARGE